MVASLLVRLDAPGEGTLQRRVYDSIRRAILDGVIAPGAKIPSTRALAQDLGVSRRTTVIAVEQLVEEGYLTTRRGAGAFVADELPDGPSPAARAAPSGEAHPPLSRRGQALAANPPAARRVPGPPRPFRLGVPALGLFPVEQWTKLAARRLRSVTEAQLDYGDSAGLGALRATIADHVQASRGTRCTADQIVVVPGTRPGLDLVFRLLLDPGDRAWLEEPGYTGARGTLCAAGAQIVPVPVDDEGLDVGEGVRRAPDARLAYVTPSHQFPLGVPMSMPRRLELLRWASRAHAWVIEDDYDSEFRHGARPVPCLHGLDVDGRVIYVGTFSKSLFPALRLGFLIVPPDLRASMLAARNAVDHHPPVFLQAVLADFMAGGHYERHLRRMRNAYRERHEALAAAVDQHARGALRLRPALTGLHAVADLDGVDADRVCLEAAARGIEVMPLSHYYLRPTRARDGLLLGFAATRPAAMGSAMERLAAAIAAAGRRSTAS